MCVSLSLNLSCKFHRYIENQVSTSTGTKVRATVTFTIRSMTVSVNSSMPGEQVAAVGVLQNHVEILAATDDEFDGVIVEMNEPMDSAVLVQDLQLQFGKKGIWIKVPIELVNLVEAAVKEGFWFHHAEPNYMMLVYWIPDSLNTLPKNATHRVCIGAFVMNEKREVLVVKEKSGIFKKMNLWKFPTGVVDEGEDIREAAVREVKEETGIEAEFKEVLAFWQSQKVFYEKSDLFFICMLQPRSFVIEKQESEIEEAMWMPFEEYGAQEKVKEMDLLKRMYEICEARVDRGYTGFSQQSVSNFTEEGRKSSLFSNSHALRRH
ncbi:hypothetical protein FNV43_RR07984 [Rhamnella rubrinervis]|uniref:Nudix hydrolase domain-containing protein n=1 Tax=Rhamnella rubrinervis TaxID=2594499 RepID=A0A8K0HHP9_9ROSA|nr:hypothetical protein FNV43_RR07984 [Rhamnella rubrinervis]